MLTALCSFFFYLLFCLSSSTRFKMRGALSFLLLFLTVGLLLCGQQVVAKEDPAASIPGVVELTPENFDAIYKGSESTPYTLVLFYAPWCGHCHNFVPELRALASAYEAAGEDVKRRLTIGKLDADAHRELGEQFGVTGFPTILLLSQDSTKEHIHFTSKRKASVLSQFLSENVEQFPLLVEAGPEEEVAKPIGLGYTLELDHKNFGDVVFSPDKDVLVFFYAPWCYYCKNFAHDYRALAEIFYTDREHVVIARMDATRPGNEEIANRYHVESFPTLYLFRKGATKGKSTVPTVYGGARRLEDLLVFMNDAIDRPRMLNGDLTWEYGVNTHLSQLLLSYSSGPEESKAELLQAIHQAQSTAAGPGVEYYKYLIDHLERSYDPPSALRALEQEETTKANSLQRGAERDLSQLALNIVSSISSHLN